MNLEAFLELLREMGVEPVQADVSIVCVRPEDRERENPSAWIENIQIERVPYNSNDGPFEVVVYMCEGGDDEIEGYESIRKENAPIYLFGKILNRMMKVWRDQTKAR